MSTLKKLKAFELTKSSLKKINGGKHNCGYYKRRCRRTARLHGNLFLIDDCNSLCD